MVCTLDMFSLLGFLHLEGIVYSCITCITPNTMKFWFLEFKAVNKLAAKASQASQASQASTEDGAGVREPKM